MLTIVLSGPGGFATQAARSLTDAGLRVHEDPVTHGLPDKVTGGADPTVGFLTCEGDDVDAAAQAVASLKWVLRAHYASPAAALAVPSSLLGESSEELVRRVVREELAAAGR